MKVTVALTCDAPSVAVTTTETLSIGERLHWMLKLPELLLAGIVTCLAEREIMIAPIGDVAIVSCTIAPSGGAGPLSVIMPFAVAGKVVGTVGGVKTMD